jgi:hypothetical protein
MLRVNAPMPRGVRYGFTTRQGGAPEAARLGPFSGLTLARAPEVPDAAVTANWALALAALDDRLGPADVALATQVHGDRAVRVDEATGPLATVGEADALFTTRPGLALAVRVADCVPVLVASPKGIAAIHAGWRGVASKVVAAAIGALLDETGERPDQLVAAIGPHISQDRFEVGREVVDGIVASGVPEEVFAVRRGDRWYVDLTAAIEVQLRVLRVGAWAATGACATGPRFYSYRRDAGRTGRMAGMIVRW